MAADIGERANGPVVAAGDEDRLPGDLEGEVITGARHLIGSPDAEPLLHEDLVDLAAVPLRRGVADAREIGGTVERQVNGRELVRERHR
jgi:hypothetical protein